MTKFQARMICMVVATLCSGSAWAQIEPVGPLTLLPQQTFATTYTNVIPPNPHYKELQFTGTANVPPGAVADLFVQFDYIDQNNQNVIVPAPTSLFTVIGGAPTVINTGIMTLMFCPTVVSLHLTNQDLQGVSMNVTGSFRHQCFPVPEPASAGFLGLCAAVWGAGPLRRRAARSID